MKRISRTTACKCLAIASLSLSLIWTSQILHAERALQQLSNNEKAKTWLAEKTIKPNVSGKPVVGKEAKTFSNHSDKTEPVLNFSQDSSPTSQPTPSAEPATLATGRPLEERMRTPLFDLQDFARVQSLELKTKDDAASGEVSLINLNYKVNSWYLLRIRWPNQKNIDWYHLENAHYSQNQLLLDPNYPGGIVIRSLGGQQEYCDLWSADGGFRIKLAKFRKQPYAELCQGQVYLRNTIEGYRTTKEWVVEFLRDRVWGGEAITNIVKNTIYKDKFLIDGEKKGVTADGKQQVNEETDKLYPKPAQLADQYQGRLIAAAELGIEVADVENEMMAIGRWYPSLKQPGAFLSVMEAQAAHESILNSFKDYVKGMDDIESKALNYLIAFDLSQFNVNFAIGTEHPRVEWSDRVDEKYRDPALPGPDGFAEITPITPTGLVPPYLSEHIVATFTGGFKRSHAAFKWGRLAESNFGHHYGLMEHGVILSRLHSELASIIIYQNGDVEMKTWEEADNKRISEMRHVRQNGVPVVQWDEKLQQGVPGRMVSNWTLGNWSGSQDRKFRSLRAGMCLQTTASTKFLIYGYFSSVTPTAMARVFQAYGCDYAIHLDMNALEHTYLALYAEDKEQDNTPSHLIKGMKVLDERFRGNVPRFIGYPDNRDFFYLTRSASK